MENCAGLNKAAPTLLLPGFAKEASRGHGPNNIAQPARKVSRAGEAVVIANMHNRLRRLRDEQDQKAGRISGDRSH